MTIAQYMKILLLLEVFGADEQKSNDEIYKLFGYEDKEESEKINLINNILIKVKLNEELIQRFEFNGIEYGLIPNLQNISTQEYLDLDKYIKDGKHLNKIAAILYRPVTKSFNEYYQIEKYESYSKYEKIMNDVDCAIIVGAMDYFKALLFSLIEKVTEQTKLKLEDETR